VPRPFHADKAEQKMVHLAHAFPHRNQSFIGDLPELTGYPATFNFPVFRTFFAFNLITSLFDGCQPQRLE